MNLNIYKTDFPKLGLMLLPSVVRHPFLAGLVSVLLSVFTELGNKIFSYREEILERLKYNGQVCRLEYCLNRIFNRDNYGVEDTPKISVEDAQFYPGSLYLCYKRNAVHYNEIPVRISSPEKHIILNRRSNNVERPVDFVVYVPWAVAIDEVRLRAVVNTYKTMSKSWRLVRT